MFYSITHVVKKRSRKCTLKKMVTRYESDRFIVIFFNTIRKTESVWIRFDIFQANLPRATYRFGNN